MESASVRSCNPTPLAVRGVGSCLARMLHSGHNSRFANLYVLSQRCFHALFSLSLVYDLLDGGEYKTTCEIKICLLIEQDNEASTVLGGVISKPRYAVPMFSVTTLGIPQIEIFTYPLVQSEATQAPSPPTKMKQGTVLISTMRCSLGHHLGHLFGHAYYLPRQS
ncbi:uncharacterized protein EI90DRAFT_2335968 [Cantharellus anzutake]|uniref:uncharacterized protein n=1 Tax=Cantharellus anzutake TaxID=1750568 RepID=UPI0019060E8A|nr:uncharacterized protein EI90DRAFT_2335968 [Cantharellus anzutake]KAF8324447.1 hypothetical protein EI90DRAFT_2335968 [Cantharellus anzutake]